MLPVLFIVYAVYIIIVGIQGNGNALFLSLEQEKQFIYWALVILVVMAMWETQAGAKIARPFALLIVLGFLLKSNNGVPNWQTIANNAKQVFPGL